VVNKQQHPRTQRFNGRHGCSEPTLCSGQLFHFTPIDGFDEGVPGGKVTIQGSGSDTCLSRNIVQAGVGPLACKRLLCRFQDAPAVPLSVCSRFSLHGL
jgi:hypothetical protein